MTALAVGSASALGAPEGYHAFLEYPSTSGMPDIVFASFDEEALLTRAAGAASDAFTETADVAVLLAFTGAASTSVDVVSQRARLSSSTVRARLRTLARRGAVERVGRAAWRRVDAAFPGRLRAATAIELKLRDWRKALDQAARYRAFADRSLVVIDRDRDRGARGQTEAFAFNGIGLVSMSAWGDLEELVAAPTRTPLDPVARLVAGERLWAELASSAMPMAA